MKNHRFSRFIVQSTLALALGAVLLPTSAQARGRSTTVHGPRGGLYHKQITHSPGQFSASKSATLPNGQSASRSLSSHRTDTGRTTSAEAVGRNGRSARFDSTATRTETGYTREAQATGPNGGAATKQVTVTKENGVVTREVITSVSPKP